MKFIITMYSILPHFNEENKNQIDLRNHVKLSSLESFTLSPLYNAYYTIILLQLIKVTANTMKQKTLRSLEEKSCHKSV